MRNVALVVVVLALAAVAAWAFAPRVMAPAVLPVAGAPPDIAAHVVTRNADPSIRPGDEDVLVWAGAQGARAPWAVVYLHGYSASPAEIRPVPEQVAAALGANLYIPRLTGHGQDGAAMGRATAEDWLADTVQALAIGRALGAQVLVIATSTGGTLATIALSDPAQAEGVAGVVLVSPNFGVAGMSGWILSAPWVERWGPLVMGAEHVWEPLNDEQAAHWTTRHPVTAVLPMAALVRTAVAVDHAAIPVPALVFYAENDTVVDARQTLAVLSRWGAPVTVQSVEPDATCDPTNHVLAGDIMCPEGTAAMVAAIMGFARRLE